MTGLTASAVAKLFSTVRNNPTRTGMWFPELQIRLQLLPDLPCDSALPRTRAPYLGEPAVLAVRWVRVLSYWTSPG
jgi:hypothetical protein